MPSHDIIDNRNEKLVDHTRRILSSTDRARFAVGYFFLSGLTSIAERLQAVKELRLLIGNTTKKPCTRFMKRRAVSLACSRTRNRKPWTSMRRKK